jgi:hypothetical protein
MTQPPDDHLKVLWQGQETETKPMSVEAIRARARRYNNLRRGVFAFGVTLALVEIGVFGRFALTLPLPGATPRVGLLIVLVGLGWMIARISLLAPRRFPDARASGENILEFHLTELHRARATFGGQLVMAGPALLGLVIFVVGVMIGRPRVALYCAPFLVLIGLWFVGAWWMVRRGERARLNKLAEIEATQVEGG